MWVQFLKPRQGYGYFTGDKANLEEELAQDMIDNGYAKNAVQPLDSDLPADLPARVALVNGGLTTIAAVLASKEVLTDIKGIGAKTAEEILSILEK